MTNTEPDLETLIETVRHIKMTPEEIAEQRISFAYENLKIENDKITRETIIKSAKELYGE